MLLMAFGDKISGCLTWRGCGTHADVLAAAEDCSHLLVRAMMPQPVLASKSLSPRVCPGGRRFFAFELRWFWWTLPVVRFKD